MRSVIYGGACSLDGYIAGSHDEVDWLAWSDDVAEISKALWKRIDVVVMGRRTYEVAVRSGTRSYPGMRNLVFSRTLSQPDWPDVEIVSGDVVSFVRRLKDEPGAGICVMGGGQIAGTLVAAGLVDEVGVNIQPIILGSGIPFLMGVKERVSLELVESRVLTGGCVYALYRRRESRSADSPDRLAIADG